MLHILARSHGCATFVGRWVRAVLIVAAIPVGACKEQSASSSDAGPVDLSDLPPLPPDPVKPAVESVDVSVEAARFLNDYKDNELRGDAKYKGKRVRIVGKAGEVKRDLTGGIYLTVGRGDDLELPEVQCFFADEHAARLSSVARGQEVVVKGTVDGLMGNVLVKDCSFSSVAAFTVCEKLKDAGTVAYCILSSWKHDEVVPFITAMPPHGQSKEQASEFFARTEGLIVYAESDDAFPRVLALADARSSSPDAGFGRLYIASPSARIVVQLPPVATPALQARVKALVDRLPRANSTAGEDRARPAPPR